MFFHITLNKNIQLPPKFLGANLRKVLIQKLKADVEGECSVRYGYVVAVTSIEEVGNGKIDDTLGHVTFPVQYKAIVFRLFKSEVIDAVVINVSSIGFFATVGPVHIFVSDHCMPPELKYEPTISPACFVTEDQSYKIAVNSEVRLKIMNTRLEGKKIFAIGTILGDYLGPMDTFNPTQ